MFPFSICKSPGCTAFASKDSEYCFHHLENDEREKIHREIISLMKSGKAISNFSLENIEIRDIEGKGLKLLTNNFSYSVFENCNFSGGVIVSCFFDYCLFSHCTFSEMDIRYSVFAASSFIESTISDSTVIHNNFIGIDAIDSNFSANDFYFSNFSLSRIVNTDFEDCNLKRTNFRGAMTRNVSLRYSNPEEAFFHKGEEWTI